MAHGYVKRLWQDEEGAVTVDWVVLTAGLIAFGVLVVSTIAGSATSMSTGTGSRLSRAVVPNVSF